MFGVASEMITEWLRLTTTVNQASNRRNDGAPRYWPTESGDNNKPAYWTEKENKEYYRTVRK